MTVRELSTTYSSVPWKEYFNTLLAPSVEVTEDEVVIVSVPSYIANLEKLLATVPKRVQANYVMWRAAASSVSYLTDEIRKRQLQYSTALSGKTEREPRWKECIDTVSGSLAISVGAMYVRKYFKEDAKKNALEMVADIREEFTKILKKVRVVFRNESMGLETRALYYCNYLGRLDGRRHKEECLEEGSFYVQSHRISR